MDESPGAGSWLEMTIEENAIDYLEKSADFIQREDPYKWKWVSISLHAALYAFAICALRGTDPDRVTIGRKKRKLIDFPEARERCQRDEYMLLYADSKTLVLSKDEEEAIEKISQALRNNFIHFSPMLWFIETSGMPLIVRHCCRVVRFLVFESGNVRLNGDEKRIRIQSALSILENAGAAVPH